MAGTVPESGLICRHRMPFGATVLPEGQGVRFRLWAPTADTVELCLSDGRSWLMAPDESGWYELTVPDAGHGTLYQYRIDSGLQVPDPASRYQPHDVHGPSMVVDPAAFVWQDAGWQGRPWAETVIYELHVGTFSPEGTFDGVRQRLPHLARLGVTAIELMPLSDFPGARNWGYDGVQLFAPDSRYGSPESLKALIQAAHDHGLMVFLDVVYNHFGPEGNYLHAYARSFFTDRHSTPWGDALDFESNPWVREFFIQNALFWLTEYRFDGLRLDAVHEIRDTSSVHVLSELAQRVRDQLGSQRHVHLVLENDHNQAQFLDERPDAMGSAYTAQWNDDFHHAMHVLLTGDAGGYYADYDRSGSSCSAVAHLGRCLAEGFAYQGEPSRYRGGTLRGTPSQHLPPVRMVNFLQNHDQIGNRAFGERLTTLCAPEALRAGVALTLLAPAIPLLYMGEEWGTRRPFLFFCDLGADLAPLVTEGRRREFAQFPAFRDPAVRQRIPDPVAQETFVQSQLDWSELKIPRHADWLAYYQRLLSLRHEKMRPLWSEWLSGWPNSSSVTCQPYGDTGLVVTWTCESSKTVGVLANLGATTLTLGADDLHNLELTTAEVLYETEPAVFAAWRSGGPPPWSVVWFTQ